ncbi:hypothetical protein CEUSTIGMA_g9755.t1 [Chlamydomonas eustigma]|uniref:3-oxoacyl-[acyl-carrier-protein] synthase n=1 Tax=Chlamydomonas eustigma TaxID=1157962 RepID=A0A250XH31_9CHLO|nr:hypothetical protein CEUSTIGMA_g9755.t1 [Chlamydomonas eustigma]|eukprot:GAX82326.1 hypothetical protein CEUSTIGMA_g9755.t1 [Chlamydomonas eustigma]
MQQRRVVITGLGLVTPLGIGVRHVWDELLKGKTGVRLLQPADLPPAHKDILNSLPSRVVATVPQEPLEAAMKRLNEDLRRSSRFMQYALCAADEALQDSGLVALQDDEERQRVGVSIGNGMSSTSEVAEAAQLLVEGNLRKLSPFFVPRILVNMAAGAVSIRWGFQGPSIAHSTACASGLHAIGEAFKIIQRGDADVMVCGASESSIDAISLGGFSRLRALSTSFNTHDRAHLASRPFDKDRDGFVMGEGAGILILEEVERAVHRNAKMYAEVRGYGMSSDSYHVTQPHPQGMGARLCMKRALEDACIETKHVSYINAHATSTPIGDQVEQAAIQSLFGPEISNTLQISSTKGATGHLLGAAAAVEMVFTTLALYHNVAPHTLNLFNPHPNLLPGLIQGEPCLLPLGPKAALKNSFGFGGTNASIAITTVPRKPASEQG